MAFGTVLKQARTRRKFTQQRFYEGQIHISDTHGSDIEHGRREVQPDIMRKSADILDDPELYIEAAYEVTGGVMSMVRLDGERIDHHPAAVKDKTIEEMMEAIDALRQCENGVKPIVNEETREIEIQRLLQIIDVQMAIGEYVTTACKVYGISSRLLYGTHFNKLVDRQYCTQRKSPVCAATQNRAAW